jgi:hypothetical protein
MPRSLLTVVLMLAGCELEKLPTAAGEHVVYHWDADEYQLCGGTIPLVDRHIENITGYYGWPASERRVEYFWDGELARQACSRFDALGCADRLSESTMVFADIPVDTHELGHTTRVGSHVKFINEGFSTRWSSSILELSELLITAPTFLGETELRAALEANDARDFSYVYASMWWITLEVEYGPAKMAEFVTALEGAASADDVEAALERAFGISLADSIMLAKELPIGFIDDPACALEGLPSYTWAGEPLVVKRDEPMCADEDIVNVFDDNGMWLFEVEFPNTKTVIDISVIVPEGEDTLRKALDLAECSGKYHLGQPVPMNILARHPGMYIGNSQRRLRGRYVGALTGPLLADGSVEFPRVVFRQAPP